MGSWDIIQDERSHEPIILWIVSRSLSRPVWTSHNLAYFWLAYFHMKFLLRMEQNQWRIPDFSGEGEPTPEGMLKTINLQNSGPNCIKMTEFEPRRRASLGPPWVRHWKCFNGEQDSISNPSDWIKS